MGDHAHPLAQVTAVDDHGRNFIGDVGEGDLWFFPSGYPHSIQGLHEGCEFLLVFDAGDFNEFDTFMVTDWFNHTPPSVLAKNFGVSQSAFAKVPPESTRYSFPARSRRRRWPREHRERDPALPRVVPQQLLRRRLARHVARADAARDGPRDTQSRSAHNLEAEKRETPVVDPA